MKNIIALISDGDKVALENNLCGKLKINIVVINLEEEGVMIIE